MSTPLDAADNDSSDRDPEPRAAFLQLCHANGLKEEDLLHPERVTHIEMVLDDYCCMRTLKHFSGLRSLCLIQQAIAKIEGLECCHNLERLLLNENCIKEIEGLENCTNLKQLFLCTNLIAELGSGLAGLKRLEVLWVAENRLANLHGLSMAPALTELNAARNRIATVVGAFQGNLSLQSLNIADNRVCSFVEVLDIAKLENLRELCLADPDWGDNPICSLSNYHAYVLYHLPGLRVHDRIHVSAEDHRGAEAAFSKKAVYYSARIKLTARQAADGLRVARALHDECVAGLTRDLEAAARASKGAEAHALARSGNLAATLPPMPLGAGEESPEGCEAALRLLRKLRAEVADAETVWAALERAVQSQREALAAALWLELRAGGNVRAEPGVPGQDAWVGQVEELVRARSRVDDFAHLGIGGLKVRQVTRIHHRSLRIVCDELLDRLELEAHHQFEYLFYVPDPEHGITEYRAVAEEGLRSVTAQNRPALLTNSVAVAEAPRLEQLANTEAGQAVARAVRRAVQQWQELPLAEQPRNDMCPKLPVITGGMLLICGVYLCDPQPASPMCFEGAAGGVHTSWPQEVPSATPQGGGVGTHRQTVFRCKSDDPSQKVWRISQPDLVLPEYLVELEYVYNTGLIQPQLAEKEDAFGPFYSLLRDFSCCTGLSRRTPQSEDAGADCAALHCTPSLSDLPVIEKLDSASLAALESTVVSSPGTSVLTMVRILNLHGRGIKRLDPDALQPLTSLQTLLLSFNSLKSVSSLSCSSLTRLDVSFNLVEAISVLSGIPALQHLDISWNSLLSADAISVLCRDVPQLRVLAMAGNPVAKDPTARVTALARLQHLQLLDEQAVSPGDALEAQRADRQDAGLTDALLLGRSYCCASSARHGFWPRPAAAALDPDCTRVQELLSRPGGGSGDPLAIARASPQGWKGLVEFVDLGGLGLTDLGSGLSGLTRIRRLRLSNNRIASLEPLGRCTSLEELDVEGNGLTSLQGVAELRELRRLDAGSNQISDVLSLQQLAKLSQLSLEDNNVDSLDTFTMLHGLVELYVSNNLMEDLRSVLLLKYSPKLVVLDLSGNELCSAPDYRHYSIYHLRQLKVLDGLAINQAEQHAADERFSGKVTMELLQEKLGPSPSCYNLRSVDLSNQSLKDLGHLLNDDIFPSLRELTLDGNPFCDIRNVGPLSKMLVLRMNRTKIDLEKGMVGEGEHCGGVGALPHLQVLEMGSSGIVDMSHFVQFPLQSLRVLHLPGNEISRVDGLSRLEQLRELVLDRNRIRQFDEHSFEGLKSLRELRAEDNGLKSLAHLGPLPRLRGLYLALNRVAELGELEKLRSLRHILLIDLSANPVARKPMYRTCIIQAAGSVRAIDGKEVTADEREKVEQLCQMTDASKQLCRGMYIFTDQQ